MDLSTLDQETRCFVLLGQFFHTWANMERALHAATGYALNIDATKVQILAVNIDFENKLYIINTLVDANQDFSADDRKQYSKTIEEFGATVGALFHPTPDATAAGKPPYNQFLPRYV